MIDIDPKLTKIIALAREGIGGEKTAAIKAVRRICEREGLDFDDVMNASDERDYVLEIGWKTNAERDILGQVCFRFAITEQHPNVKINHKARVFLYTTTPSKHIETVNAAAIYLRAFRKERKRMEQELIEAYVIKHRLFAAVSDDSNKSDKPPRERDPMRDLRLEAMMMGMDNVQVQKTIEGGDGKNNPA